MCGTINNEQGRCHRLDEGDDVDDSRMDVRCNDVCHVSVMGHDFDFTATPSVPDIAVAPSDPTTTVAPTDPVISEMDDHIISRDIFIH